MGKKGRSSRRDSGDDGYALLALFALASVFYAKVMALDWHWRIVFGVFIASLVFLLVRALLRFVRRRRRARLTLGDVRALPWQAFEPYVQLLLQDLGWERVRQTGGSGDGGVDLRGTYNGERWIVQCKHRTTRNDQIAPGTVRELIGTLTQETGPGGATCALLVTTGSFGPDSRALERKNPVELWDGNELARRRLHADRLRAGTVHRGRWATWRWVGGVALANAACVLWAVASQGGHVQFVTAIPVIATPEPAIGRGATQAPAVSVNAGRTLAQPTVVSTPRPARVTCGTAAVREVEALAIRVGPGPAAQKVGEVARGRTVDLMCVPAASVDGRPWRKVRSGNVEGWMSTRYLIVNDTSRE